MTAKAQEFIAANAKSPVIHGAARDGGGKGALYTLKSGRSFTLSKEDCEVIGHPRWGLPV